MSEATSFVFYRYQPSMAAAVIFMVGFGLSAIVHLKILIQKRTWYFLPFAVGCTFELIGCLGRAMSSIEDPNFTKNPYIIQSVLLLLGPTLFAASIYMVLGRLIMLLGAESYSMIQPRWLTKIFILGDVLSFFAQGGGGGMLTQARSPDDVQLGERIIIGGLLIQIIFFGFFMIVTLVFHRRISKNPTRASMMTTAPWKQLIYALYVSSTLIMIRSVYRVVEYGMGSDGLLMSKEIYLYCLDALPMLLVVLAYIFFHPGRVINRDSQSKRFSVSSLEVLGKVPQDESLQFGSLEHQRSMP